MEQGAWGLLKSLPISALPAPRPLPQAPSKHKTMFQAEIKSKEDEDICILVRPDNHPWNYLCDCGDASGLTVKECQDTRAIFISHTHFDHFCNFDWILQLLRGSGSHSGALFPKIRKARY